MFRQGSAESTVDLKPVRAKSWEAGFRAALGGMVTVEATGYSMRLRDDILTFFDPTTGLRLTQNAGATNHRGVEVGVGVGLARGLGSTGPFPMPSTATSSGSRVRTWTTAGTRWSWRRASSAMAG